MNPSNDRRSGKDRRIANHNVSFPLRDSNGIIVALDRRITADRRTEGLEVTVADMSQDYFNDYLKKFQMGDA